MADTIPKSNMDLVSLKNAVAATSVLIDQLQTAIKSQASNEVQETPTDLINALDLAHDAARLIRAHSTKLSLLIINKPFTPSAISGILRELTSGPLPALAAALEQCDARAYTKVMRSELQWRIEKVYSEVAALIKEIPLSGEVLTSDQKNGSGTTTGKGSLASTGVVWRACDELQELKEIGIAGLIIQKTEQYRDTLKDALMELQEWGAEKDDSEDEEEDEEDGVAHETSSAQDAIDDLFQPQSRIPRHDPSKIRARLESSLRRLKLMVLMYQAITKRRLTTLPALPQLEVPHHYMTAENMANLGIDPGVVSTLDSMMDLLKKIPDVADELASSFYELDDGGIDERMDECFFTGFAAVQLLSNDWNGRSDEFSSWAQKFQIAMKKGW